MSSANVDLPPAPTPPRSEPALAGGKKQIPDIAYSVGAIVLLLVIWFLVSHSSFVKPGYIPTPEELGKTFVDLVRDGYQGKPLYEHIGISLFRTLTGFLPILLIIGVFYVMLIRPQQKRQRELQEMISTLKTGDRVVTTGGVIGTITTVKDTSLLIRSADKSILEIARSAVAGIEGEEKK